MMWCVDFVTVNVTAYGWEGFVSLAGHKMVTVPSGGVSGIPHSYVPSKTSDLNIWPALQVMQTQQSQILSELQILRSSLQKTVFHPEIVKRLDFLSQKFQIFLVSAILVFVACVLMLMFR